MKTQIYFQDKYKGIYSLKEGQEEDFIKTDVTYYIFNVCYEKEINKETSSDNNKIAILNVLIDIPFSNFEEIANTDEILKLALENRDNYIYNNIQLITEKWVEEHKRRESVVQRKNLKEIIKMRDAHLRDFKVSKNATKKTYELVLVAKSENVFFDFEN